ncbi:hypothetical protein AB0D67_35670 [Streptosporangium sp. NPDC048047]|uniref:hypothetical protein n=1 Tax=Streptosporangium sp. NPDC048047 TaxID=3155748 RepID=UPI003437E43C
MRSRVPAVLLLLLSAFVLLPPAVDAHPTGAAPAAWWSGPAVQAVAGQAARGGPGPALTPPAAHTRPDQAAQAVQPVADPAVHAGTDPVLPRLHPARGTPAAPAHPAVLPPVWEPDGALRPAGATAGHAPAAPQPRPRRAPARAPPSTTR